MKFLSNISNKPIYVFTFLLVVALICYGNVMQGPFFFDDMDFIVNNQFIKSFSLSDIYSNSVTEGANVHSNFYRPNQQVVFAVIYHFFGANVIPFHLCSILFHCINAYFIFLLVARLGFSGPASFFASLLFLIHPIQTEAVSYISGFADILGLFFFLSGLLVYLKSFWVNEIKKQAVYLFLACCLFSLALLSKESLVVLAPLCILISIYLISKEKQKTNTYFYLSLTFIIVLSISYLIMKFTWFNFSDSLGLTKEKNIYTENLNVRLNTFIGILPEYYKMILYPKSLFYAKPYMAYLELFTLKSLLGIASISLWIICLFRFQKNKQLALGITWFFIALLPFTGVIPLNSMFLEHWLYVPIIGICILIACHFDYLMRKGFNTLLQVSTLLICILFVTRTYSRNQEWANVEKFYLNELKNNPSAASYNNLGMYYADKKAYQKAISNYQKGISMYNAFPQPHLNLANIYLNLNQVDNAITEIYNSLKIDPGYYNSLASLYTIYSNTNQPNKAAQIKEILENLKTAGKPDIRLIEKIIYAK